MLAFLSYYSCRWCYLRWDFTDDLAYQSVDSSGNALFSCSGSGLSAYVPASTPAITARASSSSIVHTGSLFITSSCVFRASFFSSTHMAHGIEFLILPRRYYLTCCFWRCLLAVYARCIHFLLSPWTHWLSPWTHWPCPAAMSRTFKEAWEYSLYSFSRLRAVYFFSRQLLHHKMNA